MSPHYCTVLKWSISAYCTHCFKNISAKICQQLINPRVNSFGLIYKFYFFLMYVVGLFLKDNCSQTLYPTYIKQNILEVEKLQISSTEVWFVFKTTEAAETKAGLSPVGRKSATVRGLHDTISSQFVPLSAPVSPHELLYNIYIVPSTPDYCVQTIRIIQLFSLLFPNNQFS